MERFFLFINRQERYSKEILQLVENIKSITDLELDITEVYNNHPVIEDMKKKFNINLIVVPSLLVLNLVDNESSVQGFLEGEEAFKWIDYIRKKSIEHNSQQPEVENEIKTETFLNGLDDNSFSPLSLEEIKTDGEKTMFDELFKVSKFDSCSEKTTDLDKKNCGDAFEKLQKERSMFDKTLDNSKKNVLYSEN